MTCSNVSDTVRLEATIVNCDTGAAIDISTQTTQEFLIRRPDGSTLIIPTAFVTDGINGQIFYKTVSTDYNESGSYILQGHVILTGGDEFHTVRHEFEVKDNLA